jgi:hypothetical protein
VCQEESELYGTHQILVYADDVSILDENMNTIGNKEALLEAGREMGLEVNTERQSIRLCVIKMQEIT